MDRAVNCWGIPQLHCPRKTLIQDLVVKSYFGCLRGKLNTFSAVEMDCFFQASIWGH